MNPSIALFRQINRRTFRFNFCFFRYHHHKWIRLVFFWGLLLCVCELIKEKQWPPTTEWMNETEETKKKRTELLIKLDFFGFFRAWWNPPKKYRWKYKAKILLSKRAILTHISVPRRMPLRRMKPAIIFFFFWNLNSILNP